MFIYVLFLFLLFPKRVFAYLDPGTGSYVVQVLIAVFISGGYVIKTYWKKIISIFKKPIK
jgi:hypothetical protein